MSAVFEALRLVPAESAPCRYSGCVTGLAVRPNVSPGDAGFCSAICESLYWAEREVREAMHRISPGLGFGP